MIASRLSKLSSLVSEDVPEDLRVADELVLQIRASKNYTQLLELLEIEPLLEVFRGEADASAAVGEALVRFAVEHPGDDVVFGFLHGALGIPLERAILPAPLSQKPALLHGADAAIEGVRSLVDDEQALPGALLLLARLPSANAGDALRIATHLRAKDNAGTAALAVAVLASRLGLGAEHPAVKDAVSAMRKVCEKLPAKPTPKSALPVALAAATLLLLGACDARVIKAATLALGCPASVPSSWGWALAGQPRTSVDLLVAVLRFVGEQPGAVDLGPVLSALAEAPVARADGHEVIAKLLTSIGFPKGVPAGAGLRLRALAPIERRVLEVLRAPRFDRAHLAVRALGFWSHEALVDFVLERGPRFRPVEVPGAAVPAIWAWRAAVLGELPEGTALDAIVRCGDAALIADVVLNRLERPITKVLLTSEDHRVRDQSMALGLISWLEQHDKEWIARLLVARSGPYEEAFVALGLLRAAEKNLLQIGAEEERVLDGAFLSAKVVEPTRSLVKRLPQGARLLANAGGVFRLG